MNIVLVVLDTVRGDIANSMLTNGDLPNIADLANSGAVFTEAHANGPWTVPSHASMFTGKYPSKAGIHGDNPEYCSIPLVEALNDRNFETAGFSSNPWLSSEFGFDESFDTFYNNFDRHENGASVRNLFGFRDQPILAARRYLNALKEKQFLPSIQNATFWLYQKIFTHDSGGAYLLSQAGKWLGEGDQRFAFVNVTESHLKYEIPSKWLPDDVNMESLNDIQQDTTLHDAGVKTVSEDDLETLRKTYKATLKYTDRQIGNLVKQAGEETVFVIVGDHGEHFGEHGRFGHQNSLYKELLHVPLIINGPGIESTEVNESVEIKSLYNFIIGLSNGEIQLPKPVEYPVAEVVSPVPNASVLNEKGSGDLPEYVLKYKDGAKCVFDNDNKIIQFPNGQVELIEGDLEEVKRLRPLLPKWDDMSEKSQQTEIDISESTKARLDDLGYL